MISTMHKRHREDYIENRDEKRQRVIHPDRVYDRTKIPKGWLDCPPFGHEIGFIIPSKVPFSDDDGVPFDKRYTLKHCINKWNLGLVIDLTNTSRYYPTTELRHQGIKHVKIPCSGHDSVPDNVSVNTFVNEVDQFIKHNFKKKYVLVHCTHGHNRTGFMIVHYLMRFRPMMTVTEALKTFSDARPPGIYKRDYIDALYSFYHEVKPETLVFPITPEWKRSEWDEVVENDAPPVQEKNQETVEMSNDDVLGDEIPFSQEESYKRFFYTLRNNVRNGMQQFPGSHPVSLDKERLQLLRQRYYYATWKADGTRYMLLLTREGCYLIDRKFRFRRIQMRFPCKHHDNDQSGFKVHHETLLDGEMVVDTYQDEEKRWRQVRRYLVYDLVAINGSSVTERPFSERLKILDEMVIRPRNDERKVRSRWYRYEQEPFGVRIKGFCLLSAVEEKLFKELIPNLSHEADGLIFQGWDDPYVFGVNKSLLKWKYAEMNSVDFLFEIDENGRQMLFLYENGKKKFMEGYSVEFRGDHWNQPASYYSGKIVECSWDKEKKVWVVMRIRVDKATPNGIRTALNVIKSIKDDITKEVLLKEVKEIISLPMYAQRIQMDIQAASRRKDKMHGNRRLVKETV